MKKQPVEVPAALLILVAFLAPIIGGQIPLEVGNLQGGVLGAILAAFQSPDAALTAHLILGGLVLVAFALLMLGRRVVQVPNNFLGAALLIFFGLAAASPLLSNYRIVSISVAAEWLTYGFAFYAVVGTLGRRLGPKALLTATFAGCAIQALLGILEYGSNRAVDPSWRIFGMWNNPNALAAMLLVGFFLGAGLAITYRRVEQLLCVIGTVLIAVAIYLTQSKGALLVLLAGLTAFVIAIGTLTERKFWRGLVEALAVLAVVMGIAKAITRVPTENGGASAPVSRLADAGASMDQSAGFRQLLWKTSASLIKENPAGYGFGSFRYLSAKPGLTTQTVYAHNAYLQLAVEGSVVLPLVLIAAVVLWLLLAFRGFRTLPEPNRTLQIALVTAVGAVLAHSLIDSDLYYYGVGLSVFLLMGAGLLLSADSVAPEFLFPALRRVAAAFAGIVLLINGYFAYVEIVRADARHALLTHDSATAASDLDTLRSIAPADGDAWHLAAQAAPTLPAQIQAAKHAVEAIPNTRNFRLLGNLESQAGDVAEAISSYEHALRTDPNNLSTLLQLAETYQKNGDQDAYRKTLERLVKVEDTSYFKIRSLPELVPTETYQARIELADLTNDANQRRTLLTAAVKGFRSYLSLTVPSVLRMAKADPPMPFGGESVEDATTKLRLAANAAQRLADLDRKAADNVGAAAAEADRDAFLGGIK